MIFAIAIVFAMVIHAQGELDTVTGGDMPPPPPPPDAISPSLSSSGAGGSTVWAKNSFRAPFDSFEKHSGDRFVNQYWTVGGDVNVNHNYVRLTNDRQNKRGWLYNKEPIKARDFSIQIKFRVSGQGQNLFGDGFVLWVVQNKVHEWSKSGEYFAGPRGFTGFAVTFDTYKNSEMAGTHKDIYLLTNDGDSELDIHNPTAGCTSSYRWFEKREDFSVKDYALARVSYNSGTNRLKVEIDGANTDRFVECFDTELPHGQFIAGSHIALSATTGQLADNHDILAVDTASLSHEFVNDDESQSFLFRDIAVLESKIQKMPGGPETLTLMKLWRKEQEKHFNHLHHQFEHEIEFLRDSMRHTINKIKKAEEADAARITKLEKAAALAAKQNIADEINNAKRELSTEFSSRRENDITRSRHHTLEKLQELESNLHDKINKKITEAKASGGDDTFWKVSSLILLVMIFIVVFIAYRKYKQIYDHGHLP